MADTRLVPTYLLLVPLVVSSCNLFSPDAPSDPPDSTHEWRYYGADAANTRYSPLDQIDSTNVSDLRIIWRKRTPDRDLNARQVTKVRSGPHESTPLMVNGVLYANSPLNFIIALDAAAGEERWTFDPETWKRDEYWSVLRGVTYWTDGDEERILFGTGTAYLYALDATTGEPVADFGEGGRVDLAQDLSRPIDRAQLYVSSPPIICRDVVVVGSGIHDRVGKPPESVPPGDVRGYDVRTGELLWTFHTVPRPDEYGNETWENDSWQRTPRTNSWAVMSADEELGYVYLPVGTPANEYYGGDRPGDNLFASSLVCLEARTGRRVWHYQTMHHGGWNLDLAHAPILIDVTVDGTPIKAVAQSTKQAFCFVFDRRTGEPLWPIDELPVPQSTIPGERLSATQPFPTRPAPFDRQFVTEDDLIDFTPELRQEAIKILAQYDNGPIYSPPSERGAVFISLFSAGWWNGAADPENGLLYVASVTDPFMLQVEKTQADAAHPYVGDSRNIRGPRRLPLTKPPYGRITAIDLNTGDHRWMRPIGNGPVHHPDLRELDLPPLGSLARKHMLVTGSLLFVAAGPPHERSGRPDYFVEKEAYLWVLSRDDGRLIDRIRLPHYAGGNPMTFMTEGRQYIVVPINRSVEFVALALPEKGESLPQQLEARNDAEHTAYYEAVAAIDSGNTARLTALLGLHPELVEARGYLDEHYLHDYFRGATLLHHIAGDPMQARLPANIVEITKLLLGAGAEPTAVTIDSFGTLTLLHRSRQTRWAGVTDSLQQLLLEASADPQERRGYPLWNSVRRQQDARAHALLQYNATLDLRTAAGLGEIDEMKRFFDARGDLLPSAHSGYRPN